MNSDYYLNLEADLKRLLYGMNSIFTRSEICEVEQFLKVGEYGVAFETFCGIIKEESRAVPVELKPMIRALAERMGIESSWWAAIVAQ